MALKPEMSTELRGMVREVLRDVMAQRAPTALAAVESVRIGNDQELAAFVSRIIEPATAERVRSGKLRYTLGMASPAQTATSSPMLSGVITEKTIDRHAEAGALVIDANAVLTPLARDRARKLGLKIERRR